MTCSASPIFDPYGQLLAVLDVSSTNSRDSKQSQFHTVALATISAKLIENCNFLHHFRSDWVLRFHNRPEFVGSLSEGMLAFNGEGYILAANQSAFNQLDCLNQEMIASHTISDIFDIALDTLMLRTSRQPNTVWPTHDQHGRHYYAMLRGPQYRPGANKPLAGKITPISMPLPLTLSGLKSNDPLMTYNVCCAERVMNRGINILLSGETGTGKEIFAKAIHNASDRADKPFIPVNCAAIPENLIESELFGYKHGAFTGARREGMRGKLLQADEGTLFLDEIGDMPLHLQTRLLRVLEDGEILPLGCETPFPVKLNIISATHRNLQKLVTEDRFREDLYYRLNALTLTLPALRERIDLATLIRSVLALESDAETVHMDEAAFSALMAYAWPGNIRQLRNVLRTAIALCEGGIIGIEDLPSDITGTSCNRTAQRLTLAGSTPMEQQNALLCAEKEALLQQLHNHQWNISNTAIHLGISRNTLYRKMKKHGIQPPTLS